MDEFAPLPNQLQFFWDADEEPASQGKPLRKAGKRQKTESNTPVSPVDVADQDASIQRAPARQKTKAATKDQTGKPAATVVLSDAAVKTSAVKTATTKAMKKKASAKKSPRTNSRNTSSSSESQPVTSTSAPARSFHDQVESISLKWGARLPMVGFGFWKVDKEKTADVCRTAIEVGYRHLDCACDYGNEAEVGQGIASAVKDGLCDREDLWVTSKLWNTYHAPEHVHMACERSLNDLGLEYLDLYLIHFPIAQRFVPFETRYPPGWFFNPDVAKPCVEEARIPIHETWQAMEELAKSGLVRNIGVCNFGTSQLRDLLASAKIRPAALQVESHPYLTQDKLLRYCRQERIAYTAFSPLGAQSYFSLGMADPAESLLENPVVREIAGESGKTPAQVLLRWGVQRGTAVIPKTSTRERMIENIDIFNFRLNDDQMNRISALDQGRRFNDPGHFGEAAFNTFLPIYE